MLLSPAPARRLGAKQLPSLARRADTPALLLLLAAPAAAAAAALRPASIVGRLQVDVD